jgi:hypothetical protein
MKFKYKLTPTEAYTILEAIQPDYLRISERVRHELEFEQKYLYMVELEVLNTLIANLNKISLAYLSRNLQANQLKSVSFSNLEVRVIVSLDIELKKRGFPAMSFNSFVEAYHKYILSFHIKGA